MTWSSTPPICRSGVTAGDLGIGGIDEEQVDALVAEPTEPGEIGEPAVEQELVQFDVAGVRARPAPVRMATAMASGIEWLTAKYSQSNGPCWVRSPR